MRSRASSLIIVLLIASLAAGCSILPAGSPPPAVYPSIEPVGGPPLAATFSTSFPFQDAVVTIEVPVDAAVYRGAKSADKNAILYETINESEWLPDYYTAFISEGDLVPLYDALTAALEGVARERALDSDEYLELITVFVQSLPYRAGPDDIPPKFPVETIVEEGGDCDDKSLLLSALLSREGYDVALLYFGEENHMAVGVRSPDCGYRSTGYAFIESTNVTFIGIPPAGLEGGVTLTSDPVVIPVGEGGRGYAACAQTRAISSVAERVRGEIDALKPLLDEQNRALEDQLAAIDGLGAELDRLSAGGRVALFNTKAAEYNRLVDSYNADLAACNELRERYNRLVGIHNYIATHQYDREGTFAWVQAQAGVA
jgi:hypothetical protein